MQRGNRQARRKALPPERRQAAPAHAGMPAKVAYKKSARNEVSSNGENRKNSSAARKRLNESAPVNSAKPEGMKRR